MCDNDTDKKTQIPAQGVTGYYWMSDATRPVIVNEADRVPQSLVTLDPAVNPFIVEAQLYDRARNKSYDVKYVDGRYVVSVSAVHEAIADVRAGKYDYITLKRFMSNRMDGRRLLFFQYWRESHDPLCEGMEVLLPAEMAFVGFEYDN